MIKKCPPLAFLACASCSFDSHQKGFKDSLNYLILTLNGQVIVAFVHLLCNCILGLHHLCGESFPSIPPKPFGLLGITFPVRSPFKDFLGLLANHILHVPSPHVDGSHHVLVVD